MPINAYTGLMGSGKSYEVVSSVIVPAIAKGRRVVTNVDGIDGEAIRAFVHDKQGLPMDKLGVVVHCSNDEVFKDDFFPHGEAIKTLVQPGDLVCIDEAWRFWGTSSKIIRQHAVFFREHRHYVDPTTKVSCDLVLMVQDIGDLNRVLKVVVELSFRTTKIKSLGLNKIYRVEMWEGYRQAAKSRVSVENKKYSAEIFPLYSSYVGGQGKEVRVDDRQNILKNPMLWVLAIGCVIIFGVGVWGVRHFFSADRLKKQGGAPSTAASVSEQPGLANGAAASSRPKSFSDDWRIAGFTRLGTQAYVVLINRANRLRYESPSMFYGAGLTMIGTIDGERVTWFSGQGSSLGSAFMPTPPPPQPTPSAPAAIPGGTTK